VAEACNKYEDFTINMTHSLNNFITRYEILCDRYNLNGKQIFSIISGVIIASYMISGLLSDIYGRKKIIVIKGIVTFVLTVLMIILGFIGPQVKDVVIAIYFLSLSSSSLTFDISILCIESQPKFNRDTLIIIL